MTVAFLPRFRCVLFCALFSVLAALFALLPGTVYAQEPSAQPIVGPQSSEDTFDANQIVEYWEGVGTYTGKHRAEERFSGAQWMEPGDADVSAEVTHSFRVDANGNINGSMTVSWSGSSWLTDGAKANCSAARAENYGYDGVNCRLSGTPNSGSFVVPLGGKRVRDAQSGIVSFNFTMQPFPRIIEVLSGYNPSLKFAWVFPRNSDIESALSNLWGPLEGTPEPGWSKVTVPYNDSDSFLYAPTPTGNTYVRIFDEWTFTGKLVETGGAPTLDLEKELLERSVFMDDVPVNNALTAQLEWHTVGGGSTEWQIVQKQETTPVSTQTSVPRTVDVGNVGVGTHDVRVQGKDTLDRKTFAEELKITVAPYEVLCPQWTVSKQGEVVAYKCAISVPDPALEASVPVPFGVPFFGGANLGVSKAQFTAEMEVRSSGEGSLKGEGGVMFEAMERGLGGSLAAKADFVFIPTGLDLKSGALEFTLKGKIGKKLPLTQAIPQVQPVLIAASAIAPALVAELEEMASVNLEIEPKIGANFTFEDDEQKGWRFKDATVPLGAGAQVYLKLEPAEGMLSMQVGVGGEVTLNLKFPANPDYFTSAELKLLAKFALQVWKFQRAGEVTYVCTYTRGKPMQCSEPPIVAAGADAWTAAERPWLGLPASAYALWTAGTPASAGRVVQNVSTYAEPTLWDDDKLIWSQEKYGGNVNNADDLAYGALDGTGYSLLMPTSDNQSDWNPQVAAHGNRALVVWQRMDTPNPGTFADDPAAYMSHMQIAAATLTTTVVAPTLTPVQISDSGTLNHSPSVVSWASNRDLAIWINNSGNLLAGSSAQPDRFLFRIGQYNNSTGVVTWPTPAANAIGDIPGIVAYDIASARAEDTFEYQAALVYLRDMDGDATTVADRELYYSIFSSDTNAWSTPVRLTNNSVAESDPQIELSAPFSGGLPPDVIWRQGSEIYSVSGAWNGAPVALPVALPSSAANVTLVANPTNVSPEGGIAVLWQEGNRIGVVRRLDVDSPWTAPEYVTPAGDLAGAVTSLSANLAYESYGLTPLTVALHFEETAALTETVDGTAFPNVPSVVAHHIYTTVVEAREAQVVVSPAMTVTGGASAADINAPIIVQATVQNLGTQAAEGIEVRLLQDNWVGADVILDTESITSLLGNGSVVLTLTGTPPATGNFTLRVVALAEDIFDELAVVSQANVPVDVALTTGVATYGPASTAVSVRVGLAGAVRSSVLAPLIVTRDRPDGTIVAEVGGMTPITPGATLITSAPISPTLLGAGTHTLYWRVDEANFVDLNGANNWASTLVMVAPDLQIEPRFAEVYQGILRVNVSNLGNWPSAATTLEVWSAPPGVAGRTKLLAVNVPALQPGAEKLLTGNMGVLAADSTAISGYYIALDPANLVKEINENNNGVNLTVAGGGGTRSNSMWLPLIGK